MPPRASEAARVRTDRRAGFRFCMMLSCLSASTVTMFGSVVVARGVVHGIVDCFGPHARGHHLVEEFPTHLLRALVERAGCGRLGPVALGGVDVGGHEPGTEAGDPTPVSRGACGESAGRGHSITQRVITTPAPARPLGNGPSSAPDIPRLRCAALPVSGHRVGVGCGSKPWNRVGDQESPACLNVGAQELRCGRDGLVGQRWTDVRLDTGRIEVTQAVTLMVRYRSGEPL